MATSYADGFTWVKGPSGNPDTFLSLTSSTATFRKGAPVLRDAIGYTVEAASDATAILGIAAHDAANSVYAGKCLIYKIRPGDVWATKIQTGVAASSLTIGVSYNIEKSGNNLRMDPDSQTTPFVTIVPREDGSTICNSDDSSVWVSFIQDRVGLYTSTNTVAAFGEL
jgi:hypothetical protein